MIKEIKYNGFTETPSDYECPDGDLACVVNLVPEDGGVRPVAPPATLFTLPEGFYVAYIHQGTGYKHYIIRNEDDFYWFDDEFLDNKEKPVALNICDLSNIGIIPGLYEVNGIGNTLIMLTSVGMRYYLWRLDNSQYVLLGDKIPELPLSFGLTAEMERSGDFGAGITVWWTTSLHSGTIKDEDMNTLTNTVMAKVNTFIADRSVNAGRFIFPFLVRYAYRLYDGTLTMHSAPVLMLCATGLTPQVCVLGYHVASEEGYNNRVQDILLTVSAPVCSLDYAALSEHAISQLKNWKDIVTSVDIFISKPIYTYDQNGKCGGFAPWTENPEIYNPVCVADHVNSGLQHTYSSYDFNVLWAHTFDVNGGYEEFPEDRVKLPYRKMDEVNRDIKECAQFYLLKSIKMSELSVERTRITVSESYLQSLTSREVMTDDYDSHDTLIPETSFVYNSRLNISNLKKRLYSQINPATLFTYMNDGISYTNYIYVFIKQDGREICIQTYGGRVSDIQMRTFLYYPNRNAYKIIISDGSLYYEFNMEEHPNLNGAVYFKGFDDTEGSRETPLDIVNITEAQLNSTIEIPNKIYTSEVNNPFYFPVLGINTIGTGRILGICAAAKALSQGQFGQFPLYAFTDEGVWALEVSDTGTYKARQPITRDVCINREGITQIDTTVLFPTDRGIMLISGSQTQCVSDVLNSKEPFDIGTLPYIGNVIGGYANDSELNHVPFLDYIKQCKMIYDYIHQRIIVYNPTMTYAYIYSLKSKQWGMMSSAIQDTLNSYPEALAMCSMPNNGRNVIVNYSDDGITPTATDGITPTVTGGLLVTRPLKLDAPDLLKTIDTIIQRGYFRKGHVQTILYGSRNLFDWQLIYSSTDHYLRGFRGTPYKYFRIALLCSLTKEESVFGCTVQYTPRLLNQPR